MNEILGNQILSILVSLSDSMRDMKETLRDLQSRMPQLPPPAVTGYMHDVGLPAAVAAATPLLDDAAPGAAGIAGLPRGLPDVLPRL